MITSLGIGYMGQLGNQMFQYAALVGIRAKSGFQLAIPSDNVAKRGSVADVLKGTSISYGLSLLDCFDIKEHLASTQELNASITQIYTEPFHHFNPSIFLIPDGTSINGFFESEKYFEHCSDEVRKRLKFKEEIQKISIERLKSVSIDGKRNVALHVRRGQDRPGIQEYHPYMTVEYYREALTHFPDSNILVFTDDFSWANQNFPSAKIMEWVNHPRPDFIDICTMSLCDDHIIANSTFSWWGAWLGENENQKVIAPKKWFGEKLAHKSTRDTIPDRWIRI